MTTRDKAKQIFDTAIASVQPSQLVPACIRVEQDLLFILDQSFSTNKLPRIFVIGAGKASAAMAKEVENILGDKITAGLIVTKYHHALPLQKIQCVEAAHPVPDQSGIDAINETIALLKSAGDNDIVICLISGGASSLWIDVPTGVSLPEVQQTFQVLLNSGANIHELNTVRKHLSAIKGGQLLQYAPGCKWFSLIISDVPGDDLSVIASGPTVADDTSFADAKKIITQYKLSGRLPSTVLKHIEDGVNKLVNETFKKDNQVFKQVVNKIIGSNSLALKAAQTKALQLGYKVVEIDGNLKGDVATVASELMRKAKNYSGSLPACFLMGGETTVQVTGSGKGGRNQHMALSAVCSMATAGGKVSQKSVTFLAGGTDGTDGPTDAAGAIADATVLSIAVQKKLEPEEYLSDNNAYSFFEQTGGLIITGPTQTNVMDIVVMIVE